MSIYTDNPTVPASPTVVAIDATTSHISYPSAGTLYNPGPNTVFVGGPGVTSATGFTVPSGGIFQWEFHSEALYATCATTQIVSIIRRGG